MEILQFRGRTHLYLEPPTGEATFHILKMARKNLSLELGTAIREAKKTNNTVRREGIPFKDNGQGRDLIIEVVPVKLPETNESCFLVLFEEPDRIRTAAPPEEKPVQTPDEREQEVIQLRRDLTAARDYLQSIIEQQDATNEELKSANEEILSSNEELQSTNEELETSKEELQSSNEELTTINEELQNRNTEVSQLNNDLINLFDGTKIPIVMVGNDLTIRRFNQSASKVMKLLPTDAGRPISDLKLALELLDADKLIGEVISDVVVRERELRNEEGQWYMLRILPYRTADNKIDGAILTLIDINDIKKAEQALRDSEVRYRRLFETAKDGILILDPDTGKVTDINPFVSELFGYPQEEALGQELWQIGLMPDEKASRTALRELKIKGYLRNANLCIKAKDGTQKNLEMISNLYRERDREVIQCNIRDITERVQAENKIKEYTQELKRSNTDLEQFAYMASHDLKEPLNLVNSYAQLLSRRYKGKVIDDKGSEYIDTITESTAQMQELINKLLEFSHIDQSNKPMTQIDCNKCVEKALNNLKLAVTSGKVNVKVDPLPKIWGDASQITQLFQNLIQNAIKYKGPRNPRIRISSKQLDKEWVISISDNGLGIKPENMGKIFEMFNRVENAQQGGHGIGLTICKKIVERHKGKISVESKFGEGSTFSVTFPTIQ
jgi:two-component system, chemotaxis family, CheB/CheR fusion protein